MTKKVFIPPAVMKKIISDGTCPNCETDFNMMSGEGFDLDENHQPTDDFYRGTTWYEFNYCPICLPKKGEYWMVEMYSKRVDAKLYTGGEIKNMAIKKLTAKRVRKEIMGDI